MVGRIALRLLMLGGMLMAAGMLTARFSGYELLSVQSDSMRPAMHTGDAVLLNTRRRDIRIGDVVSFVSPDNPRVVITHRVIGVDDKRGIISTKGDNTPVVDRPETAWNVLGTVSRVVPAAGRFLDLLRHPLGLIVAIYAPAIGIIISEIRRLSRYYATGSQDGTAVRYRLHYKLR